MSEWQRDRTDGRGDGRRERYYPWNAIAMAELAHHAAQARAAWSAFLHDEHDRPELGVQALQAWTEAREYYGGLLERNEDQVARDIAVDLQDLSGLDADLDRLCEWAGVDPAPLKTPPPPDWDAGADQLALFDPPPADLRLVTPTVDEAAGDDDAAGW